MSDCISYCHSTNCSPSHAFQPQLLAMSQPILIPYFVYHAVRLTYTSTPSSEEDFLPLMLRGYESILAYCAPLFIVIEGLATSLVLEVARKAVTKREHLQVTCEMSISQKLLTASPSLYCILMTLMNCTVHSMHRFHFS